jgi:hypothetical protein
MTQREFWAVLATTRGWEIEGNGNVRRMVKGLGENSEQCPVTAVVYKKTRKSFYITRLFVAEEKIKLSPTFGSKVVCAADKNSMCDPKTRKKLLQVLKLKEPAS